MNFGMVPAPQSPCSTLATSSPREPSRPELGADPPNTKLLPVQSPPPSAHRGSPDDHPSTSIKIQRSSKVDHRDFCPPTMTCAKPQLPSRSSPHIDRPMKNMVAGTNHIPRNMPHAPRQAPTRLPLPSSQLPPSIASP